MKLEKLLILIGIAIISLASQSYASQKLHEYSSLLEYANIPFRKAPANPSNNNFPYDFMKAILPPKDEIIGEIKIKERV